MSEINKDYYESKTDEAINEMNHLDDLNNIPPIAQKGITNIVGTDFKVDIYEGNSTDIKYLLNQIEQYKTFIETLNQEITTLKDYIETLKKESLK